VVAGQLDKLCDAFRRRLRGLLIRSGTARLLVLALALLPVLLTLDWWLNFGTPWRLLCLLGYVASLGIVLIRTLVTPAARPWTNPEILAYLDSVLPADQGMLLDLHELAERREIPELEGPVGQDLAAGALEELTPRVARVRLDEALSSRGPARWGKAAAAALVLFFLASLPLKDHLAIGAERLFNPFSKRRWPHRTTIAVEEPATGWRVAQLEPFPVKARVTGVVPSQVVLSYRSGKAGYWIRERLPVRDEGAVAHAFAEVREPVEFYLEGGDYRTDTYSIGIVERPHLKSITARYEYPDYAGIPDRTVPSGQLFGLEGTRVRLRFEASMPLRKAVFVPPAGPPEEPALASERTFEKTLVLSSNGTYAVELHDRNGFRESKPERYEIRVTPDQLPEVELLTPGRDLVATRQASPEISFRARDDFGLASAEFLVQLDDGEPRPLSDRITGPLAPRGRTQEIRFTWDLRKMDLPETGTLRYFVRVGDVNPTGRGKAETARLQIKLVKPSEFHRDAFERATGLVRETLLAWRHQLEAWKAAGRWDREGTGREDDAAWREMEERQDQAVRAGRAADAHLQALTAEYEQNHMALDFMAGRLGTIAGLLQRLTGAEHPAIQEGLRQARPRTDADAAPERLKLLRASAREKTRNGQKMALLVLERLLRRIFDWRDLQTSVISTTLLHELQEEVIGRTEKIAPKFIGKQIEDLSDQDQEQLLTLGKQQRTIFDTETALEAQLIELLFRAERQGRRTIREPLQAAFKGLRDNRVNDDLKQAARMIENNQPFEIVKNQKAALRALHTVRAGLVLAGQKTDPEEAFDLAAGVADEDALDPEKVKVAKAEEASAPGPESVPAVGEADLDRVLPEGTDPLSASIRLALEFQDNVVARTRYLRETRTAQEMPRFVRLKLGMLVERQGAASNTLDRAVGEAGRSGSVPVRERLARAREEFRQSERVLTAGDVSPCAQQIQADAIAGLADVLQFIALEQAVAQSAVENRSRDGVDAFKRKYLLRGKDLDRAVELIAEVDHARLLEREVARTLGRFEKHPPGEGTDRARAAEARKKAADLVASAVGRVAGFSDEASSRVLESGAAGLRDLKPEALESAILAGGKDGAVAAAAQEAAKVLASALQGLRDLLEERVKPPPEPAGGPVVKGEPKKITEEEFEKLRSPEALIQMLKEESGLPPEVRDRMIESLGKSKDFPARYRPLLTAYFASFVRPPQKEEKKP